MEKHETSSLSTSSVIDISRGSVCILLFITMMNAIACQALTTLTIGLLALERQKKCLPSEGCLGHLGLSLVRFRMILKTLISLRSLSRA